MLPIFDYCTETAACTRGVEMADREEDMHGKHSRWLVLSAERPEREREYGM
jgi:hypothetical protein